MSDVKILDVSREMHLVPLQRVAASLACSERTLVKKLEHLSIPITRVTRKVRGLTVADLLLLSSKIQRSSLPGAKPGRSPGQ